MVNTSLIDNKGSQVDNKMDDRIINIFPLDVIKKTRNVIGVSFGEKKVEIIKACLKGKIINILITDKNTCEKLVE